MEYLGRTVNQSEVLSTAGAQLLSRVAVEAASAARKAEDQAYMRGGTDIANGLKTTPEALFYIAESQRQVADYMATKSNQGR